MKKISYTKYSNERSDRFRIKTQIVEFENGRKRAEKHPYCKEALEHIKEIENSGRMLSEVFLHTKFRANQYESKHEYISFEYLEGMTLDEILVQNINEKKYIEAFHLIQEYYAELKKLATEKFVPTNEFERVFGKPAFNKPLKSCAVTDIDMILGNIIVGADWWHVIDYEWTFNFPIPVNYIFYRAMLFCTSIIRTEMENIGIYKLLGITEDELIQYAKMEDRFQRYVYDGLVPLWQMEKEKAFIIDKLICEKELAEKEEFFEVFFDTGKGFNAEEKESYPSDEDGFVEYQIELRDGAKNVRIDPCDKMCMVEILSLKGNGEYLHDLEYIHNGICFGANKVLFITTDPQIIIENIPESIKAIDIVYKKWIVSENMAKALCATSEESKQMMLEKAMEIENLEKAVQEKRMIAEELDHYKMHYCVAINQREELKARLSEVEGAYASIANSFFWRVTKPLRGLCDTIKRLMKKNRYTFLVVKGIKCLKNNGVTVTWEKAKKVIFKGNDFKEINESFYLSEEKRQKEEKTLFAKDIKFSILVPLYNTPKNFLEEMILSVQNQTYKNWELCLADGSDEKHDYVKAICLKRAKEDKRIRYKKLEQNYGISGNTNQCIDMATGDYICLFDHDDILHPSVLYENMKVICEKDADFIYTDENTFIHTPADAYCPHFKPDYSPDTLRSYNYICHFTVFSKELQKKVGLFRAECDGSQDYDMILRLTEKAERIVHIPKILYYWRAHQNSVAADLQAKPYVIDAAKKALSEHLMRMGLKGVIEDSKVPSTYKVRYAIENTPLISILIPNKDHIDDLDKCMKAIFEKSTYNNFEIIIIENNSTQEETFAYYKEIERKENVRVVYWEGEFNYSAINNYGATYAKGEYILLLNNDIEVITPEWIEEMLMFAQRKDVGAVGNMLYYPDDTIQHAGVILGIGGVAGHSHKNYPKSRYGYMSRLSIAQNLSCVTAACLMIQKQKFDEINGLDESFKVAFNDVDFCMRLRRAGYLNIFTPYAEAYHYESKSRGYEDTPEKQERFRREVERFQSRWRKELEEGDPYYNPNLSLDKEDFSLR